ncbi:MAG: 2-dehydropantoate 2-reductase [Ruminococcaceae bacterium]|nr:2-dehydropantoate 2-reductase [Oscillospiraceae bacterium]
MRIAMIGSGAAGSVFASYLLLGGADITLVDPYKEHMDKVAADGMMFIVKSDTVSEQRLTGFKTAYNAKQIGIMDVVIFMTKSHTLKEAVKQASPCIGPNTVLVSLLNGLGNEEELLKAAPATQIIYGSGVLGTELVSPGKCISSPTKEGLQMNFGALEKSELTEKSGKTLEELFNKGGCPCKFWDDVKPLIWNKVIVNSTFNPLAAILRIKSKDIMKDPNGAGLAIQVITECCEVATADGYPMNASEFLAELRKNASGSSIEEYYPSMAQDVLMFKRQTEIKTLNGAVAKLGKKLGVPAPANEMITKMISCIQKNYDKQYSEE